MSETELERLVVRLVGDMSGYVDALKQANIHTNQQVGEIKNSLGHLEEGLKELKHTAIEALEVFGGKKFLEESLHAFEAQEEAIINVEATLRANGRQVEATTQDYQSWSKEMQKVTTIADEVTLGMLGMAETMQLTGAGAKAAVSDAIALAKGNADLAQSYLRVTTAMAAGDIERAQMFSRMIPQLRGIKDEAEFMSRYAKSVIAGDEATRELAQTAGGQLKQLKNDWNDFNEELGKTVAVGMKGIVGGFKDIVHGLQSLSPHQKQSIVELIAFATALKAISLVAPAVVTAFKAMIANWPLLVITTATVALAAFIGEMQRTREEAEKLNEELEGMGRQGKLFREVIGEEATKGIGGMNLQDLEKRRAALQKDLDLQKESQRIAEELVETELKRVGKLGVQGDEGSAFAGRAVSKIAGTFGVTLDSLERAKKLLEEEKANTDAWRRSVEAVEAAIRRVEEASRLPTGDPLTNMVMDAARALTSHGPTMADVIKKQLDDFKQTAKQYDDALIQSAQSLIEKVKTPLEKYADQLSLIDELMYNNLLTQEQYNRLLLDASNELNKVADAQKSVNQQVDAAGFGTSEAAKRVQNMMDTVYGGRGVLSRSTPAIDRGEGRRGGGEFYSEGRGKGPGEWAWEKGPSGSGKDSQTLTEIRDALLNMIGVRIGVARVGVS